MTKPSPLKVVTVAYEKWSFMGSFKRGALGFSVLQFWLFFRSVFRFLLQKTSVFRFWWSLRFADFSFFSIWFSVFVNNTGGFSVLVPDVVFPILSYFGFRFLFDLSSSWGRIAAKCQSYLEECITK